MYVATVLIVCVASVLIVCVYVFPSLLPCTLMKASLVILCCMDAMLSVKVPFFLSFLAGSPLAFVLAGLPWGVKGGLSGVGVKGGGVNKRRGWVNNSDWLTIRVSGGGGG